MCTHTHEHTRRKLHQQVRSRIDIYDSLLKNRDEATYAKIHGCIRAFLLAASDVRTVV